MEPTLERVIDALIFSVAGIIVMIWHYFTSLPPIIQIGIVIGFAFMVFYKRGWNDAMLQVRNEGIRRLIDENQRRSRQ